MGAHTGGGAHAGQQRTRLCPKRGLAFARIYEVIGVRGVSLFRAKAGHTGPSGNVAPPYSDGWGLAVPKGQPCDSGCGGLDHMVSIKLETQVNHMGHQSINQPTNQAYINGPN